MTKQDFVDAVADRAGMSKRDAGVAVDAVLDTITSALKNGDAVTFTGFGKFSTSARAARMGVNPHGREGHDPGDDRSQVLRRKLAQVCGQGLSATRRPDFSEGAARAPLPCASAARVGLSIEHMFDTVWSHAALVRRRRPARRARSGTERGCFGGGCRASPVRSRACACDARAQPARRCRRRRRAPRLARGAGRPGR